MKILIVSDTLLEGGAEIFSLRLCTSLIKKGLNASILSMNAHHENKKMTAGFSKIPIKRISIPFPSIIEKVDHWLFRLGIDRSIKTSIQKSKIKRFIKDYDIIHTNFIRTDYLFATLKTDYLFKHLVTVHGDYSDYYYREKEDRPEWLNLNKKLELLNNRVDQFVVISDEQFRFFEQVMHSNRIMKIYNGFASELQINEYGRSGNFSIGMMGRGHPLKGWELLIKVFKDLPDDCELHLAGESAYLTDLKIKYSSDNRIHFLGYCENIELFYGKLDLFVLPTLFPFESLPNVVIESLFFGVPVIATDTGEIGNMLIDEHSGKRAGFLLSRIEDNINTDQLKEQILYLYNNPSLLTELRHTAKKAFLKFDMNICTSKYITLYEQILES